MSAFIQSLFDRAYRKRAQYKAANSARNVSAQDDARLINSSKGETINRQHLGRVLAEKEKQKGR